MNKIDLIAAESEKTGLSKNDTTKTVDGVLETIENPVEMNIFSVFSMISSFLKSVQQKLPSSLKTR